MDDQVNRDSNNNNQLIENQSDLNGNLVHEEGASNNRVKKYRTLMEFLLTL
ncbi:hypothetical protein JCM16418_3934 [Paenibacillus pini JCM 16418]|uniref:Uncharacterized protein n=1 Tax=Paenibacillus pini JCM 16418 TaxID=1236976 RepID=W7Z631_9BACL|nr:hypothetical protein JCM16418_3934 [Paenibacillus pini JCM 16418]